MNVVRIWGGLGNQMFQYAFGRVLERHGGGKTLYDLSWYSRHPDRAYGLGALACEVDEIDGRKARWMSRDHWYLRLLGHRPELLRVYEEPSNVYSRALLESRSSYITGYFQVANYYETMRQDLVRMFALREVPESVRVVAAKLSEEESVAVHVRRGDYLALTDTFHNCGADYYERAMQYVLARLGNARFYVFSDDLDFCRRHMRFCGDVQFLEGDDPSRPELDMFLMSSCRHNIIANSSFSWWGAWLNAHDKKIVVAPREWFVGRKTDVVPDKWVRM